MAPSRFILGGVALIGVLLWIVLARQTASTPAPPPAPEPVVTLYQAILPEAVLERHWQTHETQATKRIRRLTRSEEHFERIERASEKTPDSRRLIQSARAAAWTLMLRTNQAKYLQLLERARNSPGGRTPCTICDGKTYMPNCLVCARSDGQCITCKGTGWANSQDYCPTCQGSGQCFLCSGIGRMLCAFCDDGEIRLGRPPPAPTMPLD